MKQTFKNAVLHTEQCSINVIRTLTENMCYICMELNHLFSYKT